MRRPRLVIRNEVAVYHCMSRTVGGDFLFGNAEKEVFRQRMIKLAEFCQVTIQTHCSLSNHFHLIVRIPAKVSLTDEQLLKALQRFYGSKDVRVADFATALTEPHSPVLEQLRTRYLARMGNLSVFMKELKEFFTKWFNQKHERFGTLWAERFKSVLLPNCGWVIMLVAAYVDLNPVRAGQVEDPLEYRFCGYAAAVARAGPAREGLASFLDGGNWEEKSARYRQVLYSKGEWSRREGQACLEAQEVIKVLKAGGKLSPAELLRAKVRYFSEGIAIGTPDFLQQIFERFWRKHCQRRRAPGYAMEGADWKGWMTLRRIKEFIQAPKTQREPHRS
jgi:hypothetical protein